MKQWHPEAAWRLSPEENHALQCAFETAWDAALLEVKDFAASHRDIEVLMITFKSCVPGVILPAADDFEIFKRVIEYELDRLNNIDELGSTGCGSDDCSAARHRKALKSFLKNKLGVNYSPAADT